MSLEKPGYHAPVLAVADRIGYRVNQMARGFNLQRSNLVGVIVSRLDNPYRSEQVNCLTTEMAREGLYPVLFCIEPGDSQKSFLNLMLDYQVSGIVITSGAPDESIVDECKSKSVPLVLVDRAETYSFVDHVRGDDAQGGAMVVEAFASRNRQSVILLEADQEVPAFQRRYQAVRAEAAKRGLSVSHHPMQGCDVTSGREAALSLVRSNRLPLDGTAGVFAPSDITALGALDGFASLGYRPPYAFGLMGYDNIPQGEWGLTRLSTIDQCPSTFAAMVVRLLKHRMEDPGRELSKMVLPVKACLRDTH